MKKNTFYYLDSFENSSDVIYFKIQTDLSHDQLINFFYQKALIFCNQNNVDVKDFLEYNEHEIDDYFEIEIKEITFGLPLRTFLEKDILKEKITSQLPHSTLIIKSEDLI